ncbi:MAG TPA: hypothetical protein VJI96_05010 [Candidatus Andersenbacteria bacterium]|nr:hypothetical protein [Candidatus Andersenbacteria bacterium]
MIHAEVAEVLEAKRLELVRDLAEWAQEAGISPADFKLVVNVSLELVPHTSVEAKLSLTTSIKEEFFSRGRIIILQRKLTEGELECIRNIPWSIHHRVIADFLLEQGNEETSSKTINQKLADAGYDAVEADIYYIYTRLNAKLVRHAHHLRFTYSMDGKARGGPYRFFAALESDK